MANKESKESMAVMALKDIMAGIQQARKALLAQKAKKLQQALKLAKQIYLYYGVIQI